MASRSSNQGWSKGLDAGTYLQIITAILQTANVAYLKKSNYPDFLHIQMAVSQLIWISGVLLY